jgi:hypothetical protein
LQGPAFAQNILSTLWFNPACFTIPPQGQLGNARMNSLEWPGAEQFNLSPHKVCPFRIGSHEGAKFQRGADITNIFFNQTTFAPPAADYYQSAGGRVYF